MSHWINRIFKETLLAPINSSGKAIFFVYDMFSQVFRTQVPRKEVFFHVWKMTTQSAPTTLAAGFFVGGVMCIQFAVQVRDFGALGYLGGLATSGTIREVGPLLIAFMLSGRIGAFTAAEVASMKTSQQLDVIRCLGINLLTHVFFPRWFGILISSFFLLVLGLFASIAGGASLGVLFVGISIDEYLRHIPTIVVWPSILTGTLKSFIFALVIATVCTYQGFISQPGAKGVGEAVTSTALITMVSLVIADLFATIVIANIMNIWIN